MSIVEQIVAQAMQRAQAAQAHMVTQETSAVDFENDRLKSAASSQRTEIRVKVVVDGKIGTSVTTDIHDIEGVVSRALEAAEFGAPAHYEMAGPEDLPCVKTYDPELLTLEKSEMVHRGKEMMGMIKTYNPEILASAGLNRTVSRVEYANSAGTSYTKDHTDYEAGTGGELVRGTDILYAGHGVGQKNRNLDTEDIAERAIQYFRMAEHTAPVRSGTMPVIFTPSGLILLVWSLMLGIDGKNVYLGASPLRDRLGQQVASPKLNLRDDPFIDFAARSSDFDDEGTPRQVTPILKQGVLQNFIFDRDTAARMGTRPTGHGSTRAMTNLVIDPGDVPYAEMIQNVDEGLLVNDFLGMGQGNPINGEFSVNVFLGYKIENGKITGRIKDVMLAGNAYDALQNITAISKEQEWSSYRLFPYVQVGGLSVTAK